MDLSGERRIPAPRDKVWAALHDLQVLQTCIPGCDRLEPVGDHELDVSIATDPVPSRFVGRVIETAIDVHNGFSLHIDGSNGAAEPASGTVLVSLLEEGSFTLLRYAARGPHAARARVDAFLDHFVSEVASTGETLASGPAGVAAALSNTHANQHHAPAPVSLLAMIPTAPYGFPLAFWLGSVVFVLIFGLIFSAYL